MSNDLLGIFSQKFGIHNTKPLEQFIHDLPLRPFFTSPKLDRGSGLEGLSHQDYNPTSYDQPYVAGLREGSQMGHGDWIHH